MEEAVKKRTVIKKKNAEVFINGEDAMSVWNIDKFEGHTGSAIHGIFVSTSRTETAVATKRNKFKFAAMRAGIQGTAKRRIATVDHLIDIFHLSISGMESIFNFFIIVRKDFLQYIHLTIMKQKGEKENPYPLMIEGRGS